MGVNLNSRLRTSTQLSFKAFSVHFSTHETNVSVFTRKGSIAYCRTKFSGNTETVDIRESQWN